LRNKKRCGNSAKASTGPPANIRSRHVPLFNRSRVGNAVPKLMFQRVDQSFLQIVCDLSDQPTATHIEGFVTSFSGADGVDGCDTCKSSRRSF
jgi:hypothetical protein